MSYTNVPYSTAIQMVTEECCNCGVVFGMPSDLNKSFRNDPDKWFFCPNGHRQHYSVSNSTKEINELKRKLLAEQNEVARLAAEKIQIDSQLTKANRKLKRVQKGVCPCCNRHFDNLEAHMKTNHPEKSNK